MQINMKASAENTAETIKDTIQKKAETIKKGAAHAEDEACRAIKDADGKIETI